MQLTAAQTSLEPQPHPVSRTGRGPFVSQNTPQGDGSRFASEPAPLNARESQTPSSRRRSKQVADSAPGVDLSIIAAGVCRLSGSVCADAAQVV